MRSETSQMESFVRQGTEAWRRLKKDKNWADWIKVGEALRIGRELALNHVGSNAPTGAAYNKVFGDWLQKNKFDDMDKGERSRLFTILDNLPEVERWRDTLTMPNDSSSTTPTQCCASGKPRPRHPSPRRKAHPPPRNWRWRWRK
jgi:hypothetical protein